MRKSVTSIILVLSMILGLFSNVSLAKSLYRDVHGHWAQKEIEKWSDFGVLEGSDAMFRPNAPVIRAEMAVILERLMKYQVKSENSFSDLPDSWYTEAILKAIGTGVFQGSEGRIRPLDYITREEMAVVVARAFGIKETEGRTKFSDDNEIASWAKSYVNSLVEKNYIKGVGENRFAPKERVLRAEVVKLIDNLVHDFYFQSGSYSETVKGNLLINTANVELKNAVIEGDLILAEGIGQGEVYLNNVVVKGKVVVRGGGENSVYFNSVTIEGALVVNKLGGDIRIVTSGRTHISVVTLESGAILIAKNLIGGTIENIIVPAEIAKGQNVVLEGNFKKIENNAKDLKLQVKGTVENLILKEKAEITGNARIKTVKTEKGAESKVNGQTISEDKTQNLAVQTENVTSSTPSTPTPSPENGTSNNTDNTNNDNNGSSGNNGDSGSGNSSENQQAVYVDDRFADGYPKISLNHENNLVVSLKLKDIPSKPAEVFILASRFNQGNDTTTEAVERGHWGTVEYPKQSSRVDYIKINDSEEYIVTTKEKMYSSGEGIGAAIVLKIDGVASEKPIYLEIAGKIAEEVHEYAPDFAFAQISQARNKVYLYFRGELDLTSIPSPESFRLSVNGNNLEGKVERVDLKKEYYRYQYYSMVILTLKENLSSIENLEVEYIQPTQNPLQDNTSNQNKVEHMGIKRVSDSMVQFEEPNISADGKYISIITSGGFKHQDNLVIKYGMSEDDAIVITPESLAGGYFDNGKRNHYSCYLGDNTPELKDGYKFFVELKDVINYTEDNLGTIAISGIPNEIVENISPLSATYDSIAKSLSVKFERDYFAKGRNVLNSSFSVKKEDKIFLIRGRSMSFNSENHVFEKEAIKHIPEDFWQGATFSYDSSGMNYRYNVLAFPSGKPYDGFTDLPITVE